MEEYFDISVNTLVIGGGPAGSTLARKLAKNSIDTLLVEKNLIFDKPCGGGIKSIVFSEFDIPEKLEIKRITKFNLITKENQVKVDLSKASISIVLRKDFDFNLRKLAQKDGSKLIEGKYVNSKFYDDYIISEIKSEEKNIFVKSKYLVAADGVNSTVRKRVINTQTNSFLTNYCVIENQDIDYCNFYFGKDFAPNEYAWIFPHGNKLSIGSILKSDKLKKIFEEFKNIDFKGSKIKGYFIPSWKNEKIFYKNRTFFVGDCAGQVLPFTYEGIYFAMKSADILADAIIENNPSLYEEKWNKIYLNKFKFFKVMQKIFLYNDFCANFMLKIFENQRLQKRCLSYWEGSLEPIKLYKIPLKILKYFFIK